MKKIYFFMFCFVMFGATKAFSCSCIESITIAEEFENSTAVFTATVINREVSDSSLGAYVYTLKVLQTWKGTIKENVTTYQLNSAACGVYYELDSSYLIFAYSNTSENISTTSCNINMPVSAITNEIEELNELSGVTFFYNYQNGVGEITVFPNPSNGIVHVKSKDKLDDIAIYDYNGRIIWQQEKLSGETILPELKAGIYLLVANKNGIRYSQKLQIL